MTTTIAIKPGSMFTSIYVEGHGLVLREPTLAAYGKNSRKVRAVGYEALEMRGKAPNISVVSPISEGIICEPEVFSLILKEFLVRIFEDSFFMPRLNAIVSIPLGLSVSEREIYEDAVFDAGVKSVTLVPGVVLSAIGADLPVGTARGMLNVNLGGGRTDMALLSYGGIINGCGVALGGITFDKAISDYLVGRYGIRISLETARQLREDVGSLLENDMAASTISGMNINTNIPVLACIYASDIREVVRPYLMRICDLTKTIIKSCPTTIANDLMAGGISLTGGISNMLGIREFFMEMLGLPVRIYDKPEYLQILGAGKLISNDDLFEQLEKGGSV